MYNLLSTVLPLILLSLPEFHILQSLSCCNIPVDNKYRIMTENGIEILIPEHVLNAPFQQPHIPIERKFNGISGTH